MGTELELAYDHCQRIAKEHARNFYYAFRTLPSQKRRAIYAAYAFCRHCDDIADEEMPFDEKERQFALTRRDLADGRHDPNNSPMWAALENAADVFNIPRSYFEEVIQGVELDLTKSRFETFEELREYCYMVASVVGLICIEVFGYEDPIAKEYAIDLGIAMQLTNIIRDVKEDAERDRIYIPLDEITRFGYSEKQLMDGVINAEFRALMKHQADRARGYFDSGKKLIPLLSSESRACPSVLHGVYSALLDRIEGSDFDVFQSRIGLSTQKKLYITAKLWATSKVPLLATLRR